MAARRLSFIYLLWTLDAVTFELASCYKNVKLFLKFLTKWAKWDLSRQIFHQEDSENAGNFRHQCPKCYRSYKHRSHMIRHCKYECGIPQRFECPYCKHHLRQRTHAFNSRLTKYRKIAWESISVQTAEISTSGKILC
ncbi:Similar to lola: Longitudinals lacking protein [Cotesia congregata]|uniref:Isoforms A/B/D/L (Drosophila melanogaster) n=1 Tax=Cotesia congregata TaxID=51543 RepID=A0A8J2HJ51_COTCN|nr:Similar to lola: Longitudinals lacking protein [Cotesia congregata]